jgi:hypothetical protein
MTAPESAALEAIVDFRRLPLSKSVRHKLGSIDESRRTHRGQKMVLAAWLLGHVCDRAKGIYVPLSRDAAGQSISSKRRQ